MVKILRDTEKTLQQVVDLYGNVLDRTGGGARNSTLVAGGIDLPANSLETSNDPDHISATKCPHCIEFSRRCEVINL